MADPAKDEGSGACGSPAHFFAGNEVVNYLSFLTKENISSPHTVLN
jgi:hypothetical protein